MSSRFRYSIAALEGIYLLKKYYIGNYNAQPNPSRTVIGIWYPRKVASCATAIPPAQFRIFAISYMDNATANPVLATNIATRVCLDTTAFLLQVAKVRSTFPHGLT